MSRRLPDPLRRFLRISPAEVSFGRRGFADPGPELRERLERVGHTFLDGYHAALDDDRAAPLGRRLDAMPAEWRGFAYEGAGMALALLDALEPWRRGRLEAFLRGPAEPHVYIVEIGAGWALARLPLSPRRLLARLDPLHGPLALDGWGFHDGFFRPRRTIGRGRAPRRLRGYDRRIYFQGVGRSLWFVAGAGVARTAATIAALPGELANDLWSGVGLACTYAGGRGEAEILELKRAAGPHTPALAQGAAFAAETRRRAGNPAAHTETAARLLAGLPADELAELVRACRPEAAVAGDSSAHEAWRRSIQERLAARAAAV